MRELKSVKVDNWGVFFLQKLQNFFNKTDYCDLTLQFNDNSQLKVHRLVLSACTDYFNVLEHTCEMSDDVLMMPLGLQADVIVPIVNFMYTGTLEFEIGMYNRLLKTARDMNMTVLLKLLEAHKRTVDSSRSQLKRMPLLNRRPNVLNQIRVDRTGTVGEQHRTVPVSAHQLRTLQIKPIAPSTSYYNKNSADAGTAVFKQENKSPVKGPSRFECNDETTLPPESFEQFDSISYESKPLITAQACKEEIEDYDSLIPAHDTSSTFEQLRKGYTGIKRPSSSVSSFESPPEKKPNIEDVKEYAEQQRMRKQITAEYDDDNEFDEVLDDEFHHDDDDEDYVPPAHVSKLIRKQPSAMVIKQEKDQKPTIVVKDTVGSNVNHAKIISEVLKKYPHLVKNNKNIKLKIMAKSTSTSPNQQSQSIIIRQEPDAEQAASTQTQMVQRPTGAHVVKSVTPQASPPKPVVAVPRPVAAAPVPKAAPNPPVRPQPRPQQQQAPQPPQPIVQNASSSTIVTQKLPVTTNPAPRRIDSKTMHALIGLGAENTTGPWLCLRCGINGRPISIPSYRGFRRHLTNTHSERIDPRLCEHCGWRSGNNIELHHHLRVQHDILPPPLYKFPKCPYCPSILLNKAGLDAHLRDAHANKFSYNQQCMYCDAAYKEEDELFHHMNTQHKAQAQKDGLIDYTDDEDTAYYTNEQGDQGIDKGIKILSNITISPHAGIQPPSGKLAAEELSTVASGIAASLGLIDSSDSQEGIQYLEESGFVANASQGPKFVNADGQIMDLTPEQRDEIISQLGTQPEGGVVMVLNDAFASGAGGGDVESESEATTVKMETDDDGLLSEIAGQQKEVVAETEIHARIDGQSNPQITKDHAMVKNEAAEDPEGEKSTDEGDTSKEDTEMNNESIEEAEDETVSKPPEDDEDRKEDETEKLEKAKEKLKLLAGDWSDDDEEDESASNTKEATDQSEEISKEEEVENEAKTDDKVKDQEVIFETTTASKVEDVNKAEELKESVESDHAGEGEEKAEEECNENEEDPLKPDTDETEADNPAEGADENEEVDDEEAKSKTEIETKDKPDSDGESKDSKKSAESPIESAKISAEKKPAEAEEKENSDKGDKKGADRGDRIRTLISDWGDDDEEEEEDL